MKKIVRQSISIFSEFTFEMDYQFYEKFMLYQVFPTYVLAKDDTEMHSCFTRFLFTLTFFPVMCYLPFPKSLESDHILPLAIEHTKS